MAIRFEGYERRIDKINSELKQYGIKSLEEARDLCLSHGVNVEEIVKGVQPIAFENAVWAYTLGCAIAFKKGVKAAAEAADEHNAYINLKMEMSNFASRARRVMLYTTEEEKAELTEALIRDIVSVGQLYGLISKN